MSSKFKNEADSLKKEINSTTIGQADKSLSYLNKILFLNSYTVHLCIVNDIFFCNFHRQNNAKTKFLTFKMLGIFAAYKRFVGARYNSQQQITNNGTYWNK